MESIEAALARLGAIASGTSESPTDARTQELLTATRHAADLGAGVDEIAAAGQLSVNWVRSVIGTPADEPLRDRLGKTMWVFWPDGR